MPSYSSYGLGAAIDLWAYDDPPPKEVAKCCVECGNILRSSIEDRVSNARKRCDICSERRRQQQDKARKKRASLKRKSK